MFGPYRDVLQTIFSLKIFSLEIIQGENHINTTENGVSTHDQKPNNGYSLTN